MNNWWLRQLWLTVGDFSYSFNWQLTTLGQVYRRADAYEMGFSFPFVCGALCHELSSFTTDSETTLWTSGGSDNGFHLGRSYSSFEQWLSGSLQAICSQYGEVYVGPGSEFWVSTPATCCKQELIFFSSRIHTYRPHLPAIVHHQQRAVLPLNAAFIFSNWVCSRDSPRLFIFADCRIAKLVL